MTRNVPIKGMWHVAIPGYIWHLGFFIVLLFFAPHIQFFKDSFGLSWPALSNPVIDLITVITMAIMIYTLYRRYSHPVRRKLATIGDYFVWLVSLLPVLTGYMAFHRVGADYTLMLAIHILSVNLLLVVFPFTKLTHAVTFLLARWYNGAANGRKGVQV